MAGEKDLIMNRSPARPSLVFEDERNMAPTSGGLRASGLSILRLKR